jgi:CMP-N-acetylneuraminic acid synthetase
MHLIQTMKEEFNQHGTLIYAWALAELLNSEEAQKILTKSDTDTIIRIIKKIERQHQ